MTITAKQIEKELDAFHIPEKKAYYPSFFKTGVGEYGEGDKFMGVMVPIIRQIAKKYKDSISRQEVSNLINSEYHECRLCSLVILAEQFKKASKEQQKDIYEFYLAHTHRINNWDLVDITCKDIVGEYLVDKDRSKLYELADSELLWDQRIAIISTFAFIKRGDLKDIMTLSEKLLHHEHDLMHKAIGWMLREVGKKDKAVLCAFLDKHSKTMPRTMLRYSIEKFDAEERKHYMKK